MQIRNQQRSDPQWKKVLSIRVRANPPALCQIRALCREQGLRDSHSVGVGSENKRGQRSRERPQFERFFGQSVSLLVIVFISATNSEGLRQQVRDIRGAGKEFLAWGVTLRIIHS